MCMGLAHVQSVGQSTGWWRYREQVGRDDAVMVVFVLSNFLSILMLRDM